LAQMKAKADELGLEMVTLDEPWEVRPVVRPLGMAGKLELLQHDRTIQVRGEFKQALAFLAAIEAEEQLIAIRGFAVRQAGSKRGIIDAALDMTVYKAALQE